MRARGEKLEAGHRSLGLSARGWDRCLRLARTIADLAGSEQIAPRTSPRRSVPRAAAIVTAEEAARLRRCLRRAWLIGSLAGHIENAVEDTPGSRAHELLALSTRTWPAPWQARVRRSTSSAPQRAIRPGRAQRSPGRAAWACCRHDELFPGVLADSATAGRSVRTRRYRAARRAAPRGGRDDRRLAAPEQLRRERRHELGQQLGAAGSSWSAAWPWASTHMHTAERWRPAGSRSRSSALARTSPTRARHARPLRARSCDRGLVSGRASTGHRAATLDLPGPQPDHGGARRDDRGGRGGRAIRLTDHRDDGRSS